MNLSPVSLLELAPILVERVIAKSLIEARHRSKASNRDPMRSALWSLFIKIGHTEAFAHSFSRCGISRQIRVPCVHDALPVTVQLLLPDLDIFPLVIGTFAVLIPWQVIGAIQVRRISAARHVNPGRRPVD